MIVFGQMSNTGMESNSNSTQRSVEATNSNLDGLNLEVQGDQREDEALQNTQSAGRLIYRMSARNEPSDLAQGNKIHEDLRGPRCLGYQLESRSSRSDIGRTERYGQSDCAEYRALG